jgi:hypothetical protein
MLEMWWGYRKVQHVCEIIGSGKVRSLNYTSFRPTGIPNILQKIYMQGIPLTMESAMTACHSSSKQTIRDAVTMQNIATAW